MSYRDPGGRSRWQRLWPRDPVDWALLTLVELGLVLTLFAVLGLSGAEFGPLVWVLGPLIALHASSPAFGFVGLAAYLSRRGRTIGGDRRWPWIGVALTVPLWLLAGLPVSVRGLGDVTLFLVPWNLVAAGVVIAGPWHTLRAR